MPMKHIRPDADSLCEPAKPLVRRTFNDSTVDSRFARCLTVACMVFACVGNTRGEVAPAVPETGFQQRSFGREDVSAFREPQKVFHPETWFHFIGGNVAKPGITADLEAISGAGISGVQFFHGQFGGAWPGVEPQIQCLTESWDGAVRHAATESQRLGLRFTMQNCPGWAMAGGPWITPDKAMRHLVWSRMDVIGGSNLSLALPQPQPSQEEWRDYRDVAVVAFPTPDDDSGKALTPVSIRSNRDNLPWEKCLRGENGGQIVLQPASAPDWVEATFQDPVTLRTVEFPSVQSFNHQWNYVPGVTVTVEAVLPEGLKLAAKHEMPQSNWQGNKPISLACSEIPAKTYRITIDHKHTLNLASLQLFTAARKNNWEAEAAWVLGGLDRAPEARQAKTTWIDPARIIDLTSRMDAKGQLNWQAPVVPVVPNGRWTVLRWGHVNSGRRNGPAPAEATGWECDKLSPIGADTHFAGYIGRLSAKNGPVSDSLLKGMLCDSWECETQTWTPGMDAQFLRLRGYPLMPWIPALAGYVIGDPETTGRFLRDWRATVNDLVVTNFFGRMATLAHERGLAVSYETASGDVFPGDILEYYKNADVPMCEFWQPRMDAFVGSFDFKPVKPCVSAARMYGKPRVAAEAFTSFNLTWKEHPGMLKNIADMHLAEGVTHLVFHTYTHNPRTDFLPPGTAFGSGIGTPFLRGQTWWNHMPEFTEYLARCSYLLERGRPVSDVLWYLGDEQDHKPPQDAPFPSGYRYDYCNPDVLLNRLSVRNGRIITPEGLEYRVLWLRDCPRMLPETLEKMVSLVRKGAVIVGDRPRGLATLSGGAQAEKRFQNAVETLWGKDTATNTTRNVGRGKVISGTSLDAVLTKLNLVPDVQGDGVVWTHRQTDGADWYFVAAPESKGFRGTLQFRALGAVELWNPLTGQTRPAGALRREGGTSLVALDLPASGSVFVVFRRGHRDTNNQFVQVDHDGVTVMDARHIGATTNGSMPRLACEVLKGENSLLAWEPGEYRATKANGRTLTWQTVAPSHIALNGPWTLRFPTGWGAPESMTLDRLISWTDLDLSPEARAFSGTATYTTEFTLPALTNGMRAELDLGRVEVIARVEINGQPAGNLWTAPARLDVTRFVKSGVNQLKVAVTNPWFNRLAYDAGLDEKERKTWTISGPGKGSPLMPSGLLGPVILRLGQTL